MKVKITCTCTATFEIKDGSMHPQEIACPNCGNPLPDGHMQTCSLPCLPLRYLNRSWKQILTDMASPTLKSKGHRFLLKLGYRISKNSFGLFIRYPDFIDWACSLKAFRDTLCKEFHNLFRIIVLQMYKPFFFAHLFLTSLLY